LSQISSPFCPGYFGEGVSGTVCRGGLELQSSQVARTAGVSQVEICRAEHKK
jgi:hypothetical protein